MTEATFAPGWYNWPADETICVWWDGNAFEGPYSKNDVRKAQAEAGGTGNIFKDIPQDVIDAGAAPAPEPQKEKGWFNVVFQNHPSSTTLFRYCDGIDLSPYFDGNIITAEVFQPEFIRQGGSPTWFDDGCPQGANAELFKLVMSRTTPEQAIEIIGDTAPMYNNGPTWINDEENPNLARWWDGNDFTGEVELIGVIQQRAYDAESGTNETVSNAPGLPGTEAGTWHADPHDHTYLIRWGGTRWDIRRSVEDVIKELFHSLGEEVPEVWRGIQTMSPRHSDLIQQLKARKEGINGWYKEPERFDDLHMRVWHEGQWTEQTAQQQPGWYDDPFNDEILRVWDGNAWTAKTTTKEAERIRLEREERRRQKREAIKDKVFIAVADYYSPEKSRQRRIDAQNDESRRIRNSAAMAQEQFYRDRPVKQKFFWEK